MAITLPASFTLCSTGNCPPVAVSPSGKAAPREKVDFKQGAAPKAPACASPCRCRIFKRKKGDTGAWELATPNEDGIIRHDTEYDYDSACVQPVLPAKDPTAATPTPYALCNDSGCGKDGKPKSVPAQKGKIRCPQSDDCVGGCGCNLFRIKQDDASAAWEWIAKAPTPVDRDSDYYYECMCVK
jgi:hypothetical protein